MSSQRATLTAKEAAEYLGISYWLILELVKRKEIGCVKVGRSRILFRRQSLDDWMTAQESQSTEKSRQGLRRAY